MKHVQKVIRGRSKIRETGKLAEKLNMHRPMIVGLEPLTSVFLRGNPAYADRPVFSAFHANPDLSDAAEGAERFRESGCDSLISVGGGSSIDTAKAIKALLQDPAEKAAKNQLTEGTDLPHIAIPGTAGTGSEATQFAVVYADGRKVSLDHEKLLPDGVILDASLLDTLPDYHRKACALDALCHGIESFWSRAATDDSRVHAFLAILGVLDNLKAYLAGDPHAAEEMLDASYQGGKAIQMTRTTAAHAMSYQLTKHFGIAHGHACMITLPALWELMAEQEDLRDVLTDLSGKMRLGSPLIPPRMFRGMLSALQLAIPEIPDEDTMQMLVETVNPQRLGNHPMTLTPEQIRAVYLKSMTPMTDMEKQMCTDLWNYYS